MTGPIDEEAVRRFETARRAGDTSPLDDFLPGDDDPARPSTLIELLCIEREFAWRRHAAGAGRPTPLDELLEARGDLDEAGRRAVRCHEARLGVRSGARLGRFELRDVLGRGGFAEVWRAWDPKLRREVALKLTRSEIAANAELGRRVRREAQSAARLQHPAIVPVHEVGSHEGRHYIVTRLLPGPDLATAVKHRRPSFDDVARWGARLAHALAYAHQCGVVHRDVKPANILFDEAGDPSLSDFGLARQLDAEVDMTREGDVIGTPAYMSPEQARGARGEVDGRSDVWGLGVVLYELICGHAPFRGSTASVIHSILNDEPPRPATVRGDVPRDLETIVLTAMSRERERRYQSAARMAEDLERFLERRPIEARRRGLVSRAVLWCRRNRALFASVAAGLLATSAIGAWGLVGVLDERARFREERDRAIDNVYLAMMGEAEARIVARETAWRSRAWDSIREAAHRPSRLRDPVALRTLAARCVGVPDPSFRLVSSWPCDEAASALDWSPDGRHVAEARRDGVILVREAATGRIVRRLSAGDAPVTDIAFDPRGRWLAAGGGDGTLRTWSIDPAAAEPVEVGRWSDHAVTAVAWSPDGTRLGAALARGGEDGPVFLLGMSSEPPTRLAGHVDATLCLAFSPDGRHLATGGSDGSVCLWEARSGRQLRVWNTRDPPRSIVAAGDDFVVTTRESYGCFLLGRNRPAEGFTQLHRGPAAAVIRTPQGWLVTCGADGAVRCWSSRFEPLAVAQGDAGALHHLAVSPDGSHVVVAARDRLLLWAVSRPETVDLWSTDHVATFVPGSQRLVTSAAVREYHDGGRITARRRTPVGVTCLARFPEDDGLAVGLADGTVRIVEQPSGACSAAWTAAGAPLTRVAPEPGGERLATLSAAGEAAVWARTDGRRSDAFEVGGAVQDLAWSREGLVVVRPDGAWLHRDGVEPRKLVDGPFRRGRVATARGRAALSGTGDGALVVDLADVEAAGRRYATPPAAGLSWSPTGRSLAVIGVDGSAHLWDTRRDTSRRVQGTGVAPACFVAVDPRERWLLLGGSAGSMLWDLERDRALAILSGDRPAAGAFTPAGGIAIGDESGAVVLWSATRLERAADEARRLAGAGTAFVPPTIKPDATVLAGGHREHVWGLAASPDGRWVASTDHEGAVKLWHADTLALARDLEGHEGISWCAAFSADSRWLLSSATSVTRWDVSGGLPPRRAGPGTTLVSGLACHPKQPLAAWGRLDGEVEVWCFEEEGGPRRLAPPGGVVRQLAFSRDGRFLAAAHGERGIVAWEVGAAAFAEFLAGNAAAPEPSRRARWTPAAVEAVAFSPDGSMLACGDTDGRIVLASFPALTRLVTLVSTPRKIRSLSFDDSGRWLAAGAMDHVSVTWDLVRLRRHFRELAIDW